MRDLEVAGGYREPQQPSARQRPQANAGTSAGDFTFGDFLDVINPLQHIPVVSTLYREITGDEISPHARIFGDTLYGGPMGFLSSIANVFYEEVAGEDLSETLIAFFTGEEAEDAPQFAEGDAEVVPAAATAMDLPAPLETAAGPDADGNAAAVLPEVAPGMLTGQDALNALFFDLGGGRPSAPAAAALPAAEAQAQAAKSYPLPPRHIRVGPAIPEPAAPAAATEGTNPLLFAQGAGEGAIADRMMQALDKYQAMSQQTRRGDDREDREDKNKRVIWQSDPAAVNGT